MNGVPFPYFDDGTTTRITMEVDDDLDITFTILYTGYYTDVITYFGEAETEKKKKEYEIRMDGGNIFDCDMEDKGEELDCVDLVGDRYILERD